MQLINLLFAGKASFNSTNPESREGMPFLYNFNACAKALVINLLSKFLRCCGTVTWMALVLVRSRHVASSTQGHARTGRRRSFTHIFGAAAKFGWNWGSEIASSSFVQSTGC
jgi:hypothetical protein